MNVKLKNEYLGLSAGHMESNSVNSTGEGLKANILQFHWHNLATLV